MLKIPELDRKKYPGQQKKNTENSGDSLEEEPQTEEDNAEDSGAGSEVQEP